MLVLTHFHADHVDGLPGVLRNRQVGRILTSPLAEPPAGVAAVRRAAATRGVPVQEVAPGSRAVVGPVRWQVLAPTRPAYPASESPPNDASVVLLAEVRGTRILLTGDQERPSQAVLRREYPDLRADVLKVAHHGSSKQDADLVAGLGARLALISAGRENDYGHPAGSTLGLLARAGIPVRRTDREGDVAWSSGATGALGVVTHGPGR